MAFLSWFDQKEIADVHRMSLEVLATTGIILNEPRARDLLLSNGCTLSDNRVLLLPSLVEKCLDCAGRKVTLHGRGGAIKTLGDGSLYFHNLGGAPQVINGITKTRRPARIDDLCNATRLLDALDNCHTITPFFTPSEVPGAVMSLAMYRHALSYTVKPVQGPGVQSLADVNYIVRMAEVIGKPPEVLTLAVSPVSPLSFPDSCAIAIMAIAEYGIPFAALPCPTAGTTAPITISAAVVQQNAEILAAITLAELIRPGLPIIYCGRLAMLEPRSGLSVWGGVEMGMASALTVQIGHLYGMPVNVYGFSTNSHDLDMQSGFERAINSILPALAGADELSGIGEMEAGISGSYAQMVLDNEFAGSVMRARMGMDLDRQAVDVIGAVMCSSRNYLFHKHTIKKLRDGEIYITKLAERGSWDVWIKNGKKGMVESASAEADKILKKHHVPPLDAVQEGELSRILAAAEADLMNG